VGGHCISVDPWFLVEAAPETAQLIRTARMVNDSQPEYLLDFMQRKLGSVKNKRIAILGLAYKPDVDDLRESPAIKTTKLLIEHGAKVIIYEPYKPDFKLDGSETAKSLDDALTGADVLVLLVGHSQFREMDPKDIRGKTTASAVVDAVNGWVRADWQTAGFNFYRIGDGKN
jgi:UDP-N-acetyl-D-mannosaminuronic acid dehydrogenase